MLKKFLTGPNNSKKCINQNVFKGTFLKDANNYCCTNQLFNITGNQAPKLFVHNFKTYKLNCFIVCPWNFIYIRFGKVDDEVCSRSRMNEF